MGGKTRSPATLGGASAGIHLYVSDCDSLYNQALGAGATSTMAPENMFWGDRMSQVVDPFGHVWSISTHKEDVTPEQMEERTRKFMSSMGSGG
jgi:uncharacterized glyoxalase superfamily protein PhnB